MNSDEDAQPIKYLSHAVCMVIGRQKIKINIHLKYTLPCLMTHIPFVLEYKR